MAKCHWYTDGVNNRKIKEGEEIPSGWYRGKTTKPYSETQKAEILAKRKRTYFERFGVENPFQSEEIKERIKQANLENLGVENPFQSEEIKERIKQVNLERYGVENVLQHGDIRDKIVRGIQDKYGVPNPMQSLEIRERQRLTMLERYGVEVFSQSEQLMNKSKETSLERYGTEYPIQSPEVREKARQTTREHYGVESPFQSPEIRKKMEETMIERYGVRCSSLSPELREKASKTNQERYGVPWAIQRPEARFLCSNDSIPNREFAILLEEIGISYEREYHISHFSYDFKVNNILIEINPFPTHNSLWGIFGGEGLSSDYHYHKSHTAEGNGFRCIHIFDWDDIDKILSLLAPRKRIYARKCTLKEVPNDECNQFLNQYHLQNSCRGQSIRLGLYYQKELVSIMTFGRPRYSDKYQYELLRYCSSCQVVGGAEKLFKAFIREHNPESIISYCDRAKFLGKVYPKLGFQLKSSGQPSKHWYSGKEERHITDNLLRQRGYDQIFNESYGKGTSNEELIIQRGYVPIYDCGQDSYVWKKS